MTQTTNTTNSTDATRTTNLALRSLIAQGVIGLSVCLGGYAALVLPLRGRLAAAQTELAQAEPFSQKAREVEGALASVMARLAESDRQAAAITSAGSMAMSQEALYAAASARAAMLGVRIDEFSPVEPGRGALPPGQASARPGDMVLRCRLIATGPYGAMALLVRALADECGFASVRAVRLSPLADTAGQMVHAEVETEHYAADPSARSEPASAAQTGGGQP